MFGKVSPPSLFSVPFCNHQPSHCLTPTTGNGNCVTVCPKLYNQSDFCAFQSNAWLFQSIETKSGDVLIYIYYMKCINRAQAEALMPYSLVLTPFLPDVNCLTSLKLLKLCASVSSSVKWRGS